MTDKVIPLEELEAKIAHLTRHLEPQSMTTLFEQVEEEVKQEQRIKELEEELEHERKINEEIKVRFVKCSSCTEEMKDKCLMFSENLCEGERCEELVDLVALVNQSELQNKCSELEKENAELKEVHESDKRSLRLIAKKGADLEKKISILLSCKNCPENKGGYICQKEYEDKCLAQKIQYIKELQEENAELKAKIEKLK